MFADLRANKRKQKWQRKPGQSAQTLESRRFWGVDSNQASNRNRAIPNQNLQQFSCPFNQELGNCLYDLNPERCQFGHETVGGPVLQDIPYFVCFLNLIDRCKSPKQLIRNSKFVTCFAGFHLKLNEFDSEFELRNERLLRCYYGSDYGRCCGICQEMVVAKRFSRYRRFAILENCSHVFCLDCLKKWRHKYSLPQGQLNQSNRYRCPFCQIESKRFVVRRRFVDSDESKRGLFSNLIEDREDGFIGRGQFAPTPVSQRQLQLYNQPNQPNYHRVRRGQSSVWNRQTFLLYLLISIIIVFIVICKFW